MSTTIPPRSAVKASETWNLADLYATEAAYHADIVKAEALAHDFARIYTGRLDNTPVIIDALADYGTLQTIIDTLFHYAFLPQAADGSDDQANERLNALDARMANVFGELSFFDAELTQVDVAVLDATAAAAPLYAGYLRHLSTQKAAALSAEAEKVLAVLAPELNAPESIRGQAIGRDMDFGTFTAHGKEYPLTFVSYEETYQKHPDTEIRRAAYAKFCATLAKYQNTVATGYYNQVAKEKAIATLRGYDSVFDYLLVGQEVDRSMFNRQIDVIMSELAPIMQRYLKFVRGIWGLDKITYTDLQIDIDPSYTPEFSINAAEQEILESVSVLGSDYQALIKRNFDERWTDFAANMGKSSGAFTSMAYGSHPYIMMTWADSLPSVYTEIHELGHAGQMFLSSQAQGPLTWMPSLYIVESPSTFNELLLTRNLIKKATDPKLRRFALSRLLGDTYFHNFITHLLEAAFQREVYTLVDNGGSFDAAKLNEIKHSVLTQFWGDAVEIEPGADLTWMRQSHYYAGLYSYSYSAGLTIATQAFLHLEEDPEGTATQWLKYLEVGDKMTPVAAAKIAGVDVTNDKALRNTIAFLDRTEREIETLTAEINAK